MSETSPPYATQSPVPAAIKRLILRWVNAAETGCADGDYGNVTILPDGPGQIRQVTYGRSQTTEYGHLKELLFNYSKANGQYAEEISQYLPSVAIPSARLWNDHDFLDLLARAGDDPIMQSVQDVFFDREYWTPAILWAKSHGFTQPLSWLVIYDSFIQSGGILGFLRARFPATPPNSPKGDEQRWIRQYTVARDNWLRSSPRKELRNSSYRTRALLRELARNNWQFTNLPLHINDVDVA